MAATVDWCETNYAVLPGVAEFWNSLSMLPWMLSAAFMLRRAVAHGTHPWVTGACALSLAIACGSLLFHARLDRLTQALDELPMLFLAAHSAGLAGPLGGGGGGACCSGAPALAGAVVLAGLWCFNGRYAAFAAPYALFMVCVLGLVFHRMAWAPSSNHRTRGLVGIASAALGGAAWGAEMHTCREWLKLHALWHLGVGAMLHCTIEFLAVDLFGAHPDTFR